MTDLKVSRIFYETWHIIIVERTVLVEALTEEDNFRAVFEDLAVSRIDDVITTAPLSGIHSRRRNGSRMTQCCVAYDSITAK